MNLPTTMHGHMTALQEELFSMQDAAYRAFQAKLIPNVPLETIIGIRTPELRKFAKTYARSSSTQAFLEELPHRYFDENQLHAFLISDMRDYGQVLRELELFLPYIDNWATCDQLSPVIFGKHPELIGEIRKWMDSDRTYTVRFGIGMLMRWYLEERFSPEHLVWVAEIRSEEYYVNMMRAWYFATALAKQPDAAVQIIRERRLDVWTHNKAIQKARESRRISQEQKTYLRSLKRYTRL